MGNVTQANAKQKSDIVTIRDEAGARKAFDTMQQTQKVMFEAQLEAHRKIDAVLTPEQREQLSR